jgi:hypothetical protein
VNIIKDILFRIHSPSLLFEECNEDIDTFNDKYEEFRLINIRHDGTNIFSIGKYSHNHKR